MANHPGHIAKRGRGYRIRIHYGGKMHRRTVQVRTKAEAEKAAHQMMAELLEHGYLKDRRKTPADARTMERLFDHFDAVEVPEKAPRTRAAYRDSLKPLRVFFLNEEGNPDPRAVTSQTVKRFTRWRRHHGPEGEPLARPLSNRTIQKDRAVLSAIFSFGVEEGLADANPVTKKTNLKTKKRDPEILTPNQYDSLIAAAYNEGPMVGLFALLLGETGARCESEGLWLRWEDVDLQEGFVRFDSDRHGRRTKSDKTRWTPMTPRLREAMREHFARFRFAAYDGSPSPWIFHHVRQTRGGQGQPGARIKTPFRKSWDRACEAAGLPERFVRHDLRHRRVTTWMAEERSPALIQEAVGHSDIKTTMGYSHLARTHLKALVDEPVRSEPKAG